MRALIYANITRMNTERIPVLVDRFSLADDTKSTRTTKTCVFWTRTLCFYWLTDTSTQTTIVAFFMLYCYDSSWFFFLNFFFCIFFFNISTPVCFESCVWLLFCHKKLNIYQNFDINVRILFLASIFIPLPLWHWMECLTNKVRAQCSIAWGLLLTKHWVHTHRQRSKLFANK